MASLEQRKKKWIMWGKDNVKNSKVRRKKWNIEEKETSVRSDLDKVFEEAQEN